MDRKELGCLIVLWVLSPIPAVVVWALVQLTLTFQWGINEDLLRRYDAVPPFSAWVFAWLEQGWLLLLVDVIGLLILAPLYGGALIATIQILRRLMKR